MKCHVMKMFLLIIFCMTMSGISVSAADERLGTIVDGSLLTDDTEAFYSVESKARGAFLASGSGGISIEGARYLLIDGRTNCYRSVDEVNVTVVLQRLVGNSWVYVSELPRKTAYNTYTVAKSGYKSVAGGYYYRVYGGHAAIDDGTSEALTSYSDGIWID